MSSVPKTLAEAIRVYGDENTAHDLVVSLRWSNGVTCPHCTGDRHNYVSTRRIWKCKSCTKQFSVKVGTIFEDSPIKLGMWLTGIWLITNAKNGISSHEISRSLGITQKSAWFMLHRIRVAMRTGSFAKLGPEVEVDETYIGGKIGNKHHSQKKNKGMRGPVDKAVVLGMLERDGEVVAKVVDSTRRHDLLPEVLKHIEVGSAVYTDCHPSYDVLRANGYYHSTVDHKVEYVDGPCHTNGLENFWSLFKRCYKGTYIHMDAAHLESYVDEQVFRYNNRKGKDADRFQKTVSQISGKRIMYRDLIARG